MIDGHTSIVQRQARSRRINAAANSTRRLVHPLPDNDLRRSGHSLRRRTPNLTTLYRSPRPWQRRSSCSIRHYYYYYYTTMHGPSPTRSCSGTVVANCSRDCFHLLPGANGQLNGNDHEQHEHRHKQHQQRAVPRRLLFLARTLSQPDMSWHLINI